MLNRSFRNAAIELGEKLKNHEIPINEIIEKARIHNPWFTTENISLSIQSIVNQYLNEDKLNDWLNSYDDLMSQMTTSKIIGVIAAGNLPAVGFHDAFCVLLSGHALRLKLSSKDDVILPFLLNEMAKLMPKDQIDLAYVDRLQDYDAVIATGSDLNMNVFKQYFSSVPHIIRGHRNAVAAIFESDSDDVLKDIGHDIFDHFGLGCRNVSKILIPQGFDLTRVLAVWEEQYAHVVDHHKYRNNYDYNLALYLLNKTPHHVSNNLVLVEDDSLTSRIGVVHYEYYQNDSDLISSIKSKLNQTQCVVSSKPINDIECISPGEGQHPGLFDYADNIDTMKFLQVL